MIAAQDAQQTRLLNRSRVLNYELASLIAFSFHDPKNIPNHIENENAPQISFAAAHKYFMSISKR